MDSQYIVNSWELTLYHPEVLLYILGRGEASSCIEMFQRRTIVMSIGFRSGCTEVLQNGTIVISTGKHLDNLQYMLSTKSSKCYMQVRDNLNVPPVINSYCLLSSCKPYRTLVIAWYNNKNIRIRIFYCQLRARKAYIRILSHNKSNARLRI